MTKWKSLLYYFCCIIFLSSFLGYQPIAMEYDKSPVCTEDEDTGYLGSSPNLLPEDEDLEPDGAQHENTGILNKLTSIAQATSTHLPWTWKESLAGVTAGVPAAFSGLPFTALCTLGVVYYGIIPIPPEGSPEYYATMAAFGAPPCYAVASAIHEGGPAIVKSLGNGLRAVGWGIGSAYNAIAHYWNGPEEEDKAGFGEAVPENKEASYTVMWTEFKENWLSFSLKPKIYSWVTAGAVTLFYCGFYFDFLVKLETEHYKNNPESAKIWGYTFGALSIPFTWYIFVYSTRNPHIHIFRQLSKDNRVYVNKISLVQDIIRKSRGYLLCGRGAKNLGNLDSNWDTIVAPSHNTLGQAMDDIINESGSPLYEESWRHKATVCSTWASFGFGIYNTCFMKPLIVYFLLHKFLAACGLSGEDLELASGIPTGLSFPLLALITARVLPLSQKEIYRWLDWGFKPEESPGYWGERSGPLLARWCSLTTVGLPTAFYLKREVLNLQYLKDYPSVQYCLIVPFVAFDIMPAASLFYGVQLHKIAKWCAKGAPFYRYRLFCCYDNNEVRIFKPLSFSLLTSFEDQEIALRLMGRLEVAKRELDTNDKDLKIWGNKRLAWKKEGEDSPLLENEGQDM